MLIGYICILSSRWLLNCDCNGVCRCLLGCLYIFCGCILLDIQVNVEIWYDWLLLYVFCFLELIRRFLWGLVSISIRSISIHSCDLGLSNRTTSAVCEDKTIWYISDWLVDMVYDSVRHSYGVPTPSDDIFPLVKPHK